MIIIKRKNGFFYYDGKKIPAARKGSGYGVALIMKKSQAAIFLISVQRGANIYIEGK